MDQNIENRGKIGGLTAELTAVKLSNENLDKNNIKLSEENALLKTKYKDLGFWEKVRLLWFT
jgi:hypothetical protein